jgi:hypothetical protein
MFRTQFSLYLLWSQRVNSFLPTVSTFEPSESRYCSFELSLLALWIRCMVRSSVSLRTTPSVSQRKLKSPNTKYGTTLFWGSLWNLKSLRRYKKCVKYLVLQGVWELMVFGYVWSKILHQWFASPKYIRLRQRLNQKNRNIQIFWMYREYP